MTTITATGTTMSSLALSNRAILQLMSLLSPTFPVGGFAYSGGLEAASLEGRVANRDDLQEWIITSLELGTLCNDSILLAAAYRQSGSGEAIEEINDLALALCGSATRYEEMVALGSAFVAAAKPWRIASPAPLPDPAAYPVAVGCISNERSLPLDQVLLAYLQSTVSNQLQAALRLISLGQQVAVGLQQELEKNILACAEFASRSSLDDLGSSAITMDIAAMRHEQQASKIFRS